MEDDKPEKRRHDSTAHPIEFGGAVCPVPLQDYPKIVLGHGGGGKLSGELVEHVFLPAFQNDHLNRLGDSAVFQATSLQAIGQRLAMSTDSYVVRPLFFPGGSIGDLAINGTVNDLAMSGAIPLYLSAAFIIEEGFPIAELKRIADAMGAAARIAGVTVITGDTKVVEQGHGDGCYINTAGVGVVPDGIDVAPNNARPGDAVILSGTLGDHGMAIMSVREGLEFEAEIQSDSAPLAEMVAAILRVCPDVHVLRDPTRGGLAASLTEIAASSECGIVIEETRVPIHPIVQSACEILGFDPLLVANEGKLVCMVPAEFAVAVLTAIRSDKHGSDAAIIGRVVAEHPGVVVATTAIGASRVVVTAIGEQLPRIC
ncbi:hydrogenase expression/formation protein HypE [Stieleria sp. ICT_E10.1]|uniref:hydrogenase expression/formation protein HypE n=1 Tax=Stieleria sedimenti TaxID=2976331 RepID=UPI00217FEDBA|nr:hydrogenase expression/formation protein HypE [Stieleria sedimenti]MCS7465710.1 hydrogenase expression/formation protein HypE [Stieleria sedimenti]